MGLIKLEPAVLRRAAKDLNQSISQLGSVNNLIQSVAPEIEYNWQSDRIKRVESAVRGIGCYDT